MAGSLLEAVARARDKRRAAAERYKAADDVFRNALVQASRAHTWNEIAAAAGLSYHRVRQAVYQARKNGGTNGTT